MDIYNAKPPKRSPFTDSPYESAYVAPKVEENVPPKKSKKREKGNGKRWLTVLLAVVLLFACCGGTAVAVGQIWQDKLLRMEAAMEDKFAALETLYTESNIGSNDQAPVQDVMTPSQVYAQNVQSVVAVYCSFVTDEGYGESFGSGFVISPDGYAVTNHHVIEGATEVYLIFHDGSEYAAQVIGSDATNDIALLKVERENLPYATIGSSSALAVGAQVAAIGNPLGELTSTMTVGYISAKDRIVNTDGSVINMLQTDAAINSGNSGGPLFNMHGEVVGITTAKYSGSSSSGVSIEGLGFAIPIDDVIGMLADLKEYGYITGAYLGVYVRDVDASAQSYGLPAGAYIEEPMRGMAAHRAGIRAGDIIVNLGGYDVTSITDLTRILRRFKAGDTTSVTVYREGKLVYLTITLDEKPVETTQDPVEEVPMPSDGNYEEWFKYFAPFFNFNGE